MTIPIKMRTDVKKLKNYSCSIYEKDDFEFIIIKSENYSKIIADKVGYKIKSVYQDLCFQLLFPVIKDNNIVTVMYISDDTSELKPIKATYTRDISTTKDFIDFIFSEEKDKEKALELLDQNSIKEYFNFTIDYIEKNYKPIRSANLENHKDYIFDVADYM